MTTYEINVKENGVWKFYTTVYVVSELCSMIREIESCKKYLGYNIIEVRRTQLLTKEIWPLEGGK